MQKRWIVAAAGGLGATGAGLLLYRVFFLGLGWNGPGSTAMMVLGVALIAGASVGLRGGQAKTVPWWLRVAVAVPGLAIGAAIGFAIAPTIGHLALHDREAAGATIGLPRGETESTEGDPVGKILVQRPGGFESVAGVAWQGGALDDDSVKIVVDALARGLGGTAALVEHDDFVVGGGLAHKVATMSKDGGNGYMTVFACGADTFEVFTFGDGSEVLQRRIDASVRCNAKPGEAPPALPIAFDAPAGWQPQDTGAGQLAWANNDGAILVRPVAAGSDDEIEKMLPAIGPALGGSITIGNRRSEGDRTAWSGTMTMGKDTFAAVFEAWTCPERSLHLLAMYLHATGTDEKPGIELLTRVRCTK